MNGFNSGVVSVKGVNSVISVNHVFHLWIMVEEMISLPGVRGVNSVKGINNIIWMSEDVNLKFHLS